MTTYNTQNPLGSADPRDLYDNAENLDEAVNSDSDSFTNRLGKLRPTLKGAIDPTGLASDAASSALRAEAARDAAFVNADIYPDIASGLAAVADGEQFQVVEGDEIVRYRNSSGAAVEVARYPFKSDIVQRFATLSNLASAYFYNLVNLSFAFNGFYVNKGDNAIRAAVGVEMILLPVNPGHTYRILIEAEALDGVTANNIGGELFANTTVEDHMPKSGDGVHLPGVSYNDFIIQVPDGDVGSFMGINTKINSFDIIEKFKVFDITDNVLDEGVGFLKKSDTIFFENLSNTPLNLYSNGRKLPNQYIVGGSSSNRGKLLTLDNTESVIFSVTPGETYEVKATDYNPSALLVGFKSGSDTREVTTIDSPVEVTLEAEAAYFTVPENEEITHAILNTYLPGIDFDIRDEVVIKNVTKKTSYIGQFQISDPSYEKESVVSYPKRGGLWACIGDSITEKNFRADYNYHDIIASAFDSLSVVNMGRSGSGYYNRHDAADLITQAPDLITVFLGTNDYGGVGEANNIPLGVFGDTGTNTISGCINKLLSSLVIKFPGASIGVATPLPRSICWGIPGVENNRDYTLLELSDLIVRYSHHYSLPVIDLYRSSGLPVWTGSGNDYYFTAPGSAGADGLHPNNEGQEVLSRKFLRLLSLM